jgi:hypothetical protein
MAAAEQKKSYAVVKNFTTLNTKANRTAIKEDEFAWIENAMPIGAGNIKVVPAQSTVRDSGNAAATQSPRSLLPTLMSATMLLRLNPMERRNISTSQTLPLAVLHLLAHSLHLA